jgi:alpha-ketoglutarate-dependent 2,4-dichlorophenoxyacetate dioxygenase
MTPVVAPLHPLFVTKITGIDVGKPIDEKVKQTIERVMDEYAVCVLPGQHLDDEQQVAFSQLFGALDRPRISIGRPASVKRRLKQKEIFEISNLDENGSIVGEKDARSSLRLGTQQWHTDGAAGEETSSWSILHARVIPPDGGDTEFADTRSAHDALPDAMKKRLEGMRAEHSLWLALAKASGYTPTEEEHQVYAPVCHPLVRRHPGSGRNALYIGATASHIIGMPVEEGQRLLGELIEFASRPQFVYRHKWHVGDLLIWDNRCTMHRATPFEATDHVRDMRRTTLRSTRCAEESRREEMVANH